MSTELQWGMTWKPIALAFAKTSRAADEGS